jgi:hypothetical protein
MRANLGEINEGIEVGSKRDKITTRHKDVLPVYQREPRPCLSERARRERMRDVGVVPKDSRPVV